MDRHHCIPKSSFPPTKIWRTRPASPVRGRATQPEAMKTRSSSSATFGSSVSPEAATDTLQGSSDKSGITSPRTIAGNSSPSLSLLGLNSIPDIHGNMAESTGSSETAAILRVGATPSDSTNASPAGDKISPGSCSTWEALLNAAADAYQNHDEGYEEGLNELCACTLPDKCDNLTRNHKQCVFCRRCSRSTGTPFCLCRKPKKCKTHTKCDVCRACDGSLSMRTAKPNRDGLTPDETTAVIEDCKLRGYRSDAIYKIFKDITCRADYAFSAASGVHQSEWVVRGLVALEGSQAEEHDERYSGKEPGLCGEGEDSENEYNPADDTDIDPDAPEPLFEMPTETGGRFKFTSKIYPSAGEVKIRRCIWEKDRKTYAESLAEKKARDEEAKYQGLKNFKGPQRGWTGERPAEREITRQQNLEKIEKEMVSDVKEMNSWKRKILPTAAKKLKPQRGGCADILRKMKTETEKEYQDYFALAEHMRRNRFIIKNCHRQLIDKYTQRVDTQKHGNGQRLRRQQASQGSHRQKAEPTIAVPISPTPSSQPTLGFSDTREQNNSDSVWEDEVDDNAETGDKSLRSNLGPAWEPETLKRQPKKRISGLN